MCRRYLSRNSCNSKFYLLDSSAFLFKKLKSTEAFIFHFKFLNKEQTQSFCVFLTKLIGWIGELHVVLGFFIWSWKKNCKTFLTICTYRAQIGKYFEFSQAIHDTMHLKTSYFFPKCCARCRWCRLFKWNVNLYQESVILGFGIKCKNRKKKTCWSKKKCNIQFDFLYEYKNLHA